MNKKIILLGVVAAVGLAVGLISDMPSTDILAVVIGVLCGVAAGIPTSILLLVVLTRRQSQLDVPDHRVIVIKGESWQSVEGPTLITDGKKAKGQ